MPFLNTPISFSLRLILLLCAVWHSLWWYVGRASGHSEEQRALVALVSLLVLFIIGRKGNERNNSENRGQLVIVAILGAYVASLLWAPNLIQFWFAAFALAFQLWSNCDPARRNLVGFTGLAILSSPLFASMEFFVGYPLRYFAATGSLWLLQLIGMKITKYGTMFLVDGQMIAVDAPCSGIKMLWAGLYLCFLLCCLRRLKFLHSVLLVVCSIVSVLLLNTIRVAALVPLELSKLNGAILPEFAHPSAGITAFAALIAIVSFIAVKLKRSAPNYDRVFSDIIGLGGIRFRSGGIRTGDSHPDPTNTSRRSYATVNLVYAGTCLGIALFSLVVVDYRSHQLSNAPTTCAQTTCGEANWPRNFEGRTLTSQAILPEESKFKNFSGKVAKFTDGKNEILFREVRTATRQLHSSADCFQGSGFSIEPMALFKDRRGDIWSRFQATRHNQTLVVREIVIDKSNGQSWSDVSSWYWAALLGKTQGPWLATTVASRIETALDFQGVSPENQLSNVDDLDARFSAVRACEPLEAATRSRVH